MQAMPVTTALVQRMTYSVREACVAGNWSRAHMYRLLQSGEIQSIKVGKLRRIPVKALEAYIDRLMEEQAGY
jgi:excisionase family DNA binding protein